MRPDAFAPAYATVAPGVATRVMVAHAALITGLAELRSMTADRLRVDQATVLDPIANALPAVDTGAEQPAPTRRRRAHRWPRSWHCRAPHRPSAAAANGDGGDGNGDGGDGNGDGGDGNGDGGDGNGDGGHGGGHGGDGGGSGGSGRVGESG